MAKIRVARKSGIYAALLVFSFIFLVIGVFFISYNLKKNYLPDPTKPGRASAARTPTRGSGGDVENRSDDKADDAGDAGKPENATK